VNDVGVIGLVTFTVRIIIHELPGASESVQLKLVCLAGDKAGRAPPTY